MLAPDERKRYVERYPLLGTIGHTPLVRVGILHKEFPRSMSMPNLNISIRVDR